MVSKRSPYRETARRLEPVAAPSSAPPSSGEAWVCGGAWVAPVALVASGALLGGGVELGALAGFSGLLAVAQRWQRRRASRREAEAWALLECPRVYVGRGTWTSPCGGRRLRVEAGDDVVRFERLAPDGRTLRSYRLCAEPPVERAEAPVRRVREARVHGRVLVPTCFLGPPARDPRRVDPSRVRLVERADDVLVVRLDPGGRSVGDTRHETLGAAQRQLRVELGDHLGRWRSPGRVAGRDLASAAADPAS